VNLVSLRKMLWQVVRYALVTHYHARSVVENVLCDLEHVPEDLGHQVHVCSNELVE